ncbi:MAG TPA: nucleoside hydrolase, partial [Clostridiales bacterium]|nr:nucleoside hydrolase [Clostridiales bacterium]
MKKIKLLIDTDMGADIDDALAISLAAISDNVEIVGITTVFKNTNERARLVKKLLSYAQIDVPVYAGVKDAINRELDGVSRCMMYEKDLDDPKYAPINDFEKSNGTLGIQFIIDSAQKYGQDLTILAIGPLSNIARAIQKAPQVMRKIGKIVLMGGAYFAPRPEWN